MERVFVARDVPFGQNKKPNELLQGQLGIMGLEEGTDLWKPCGIGGKYSMIQLFVGGYILPADAMIGLKELQLRYLPYKAEVKPVSVISFSGIGNSMFDEFVVSISPTDGRVVTRFSENYSVTGGKATLAEIYNDAANQINCNSRSHFYASVTAAGLVITTRDSNITFGLSGEFRKDPTLISDSGNIVILVRNEVAYNGGSGSGTDVRTLMYNARADTGSMSGYGSSDQFGFDEIPYPSIYGDAGEPLTAEFDLYVMRWKNGSNDDGELAKQVFSVYQTAIIAFPKTLTTTANRDFVTIIEALTGGKFKTSTLD